MSRTKKILAFIFIAVLYITASTIEYNDYVSTQKTRSK